MVKDRNREYKGLSANNITNRTRAGRNNLID
jgi:phage replication-related protein YjqB (UPF0714/DUF867 family)